MARRLSGMEAGGGAAGARSVAAIGMCRSKPVGAQTTKQGP
jgi:hypothetical protein